MFSDALTTRDRALDGIQDLPGQAYTAGFLDDFLMATPQFGSRIQFGVAIDVNTANGAALRETLNSFQLIDLTTQTILAHYTGPTPLNDNSNGNGFADYINRF
jgi:hypothetical protein